MALRDGLLIIACVLVVWVLLWHGSSGDRAYDAEIGARATVQPLQTRAAYYEGQTISLRATAIARH